MNNTVIRFNSGIHDPQVINLFKWIMEKVRKCGGSNLKLIHDLEVQPSKYHDEQGEKLDELIYVVHNTFRTAEMIAQDFTKSFIRIITILKSENADPDQNYQWINRYSLFRVWIDNRFVLVPILDEAVNRKLPNGHYKCELDLSQDDYDDILDYLKKVNRFKSKFRF